jgi:enoyl-CoA hydratase
VSENHILFEVKSGHGGDVGVVTLNRPEALNALTLSMLENLQEQMEAWESDDRIKAVIIKSAISKAFCAGGDVRYIYQNRQVDDNNLHPFFEVEYKLNRFLHNFSKPYISFCDGITMGGGVGISIHGSHRVGTMETVWAMPETKIGFFPDVGVSYYLAQCPDFTGYYLALSGRSINAVTALDLGLMDFLVPAESLLLLEQRIIDTPFLDNPYQVVTDVINTCVCGSVDTSSLRSYFPVISRCFSLGSISAIFSALELEGCDWSLALLSELKKRSPLSLNVVFHQLNRVVGMTIEEVMLQDSVLARHFLQGYDFYEGARAVLVDKDNQPLWQPSTLQEVTDKMTKHYFMS